MVSKINENPVKGYPTFGIPLGPLAEDRLLSTFLMTGQKVKRGYSILNECPRD